MTSLLDTRPDVKNIEHAASAYVARFHFFLPLVELNFNSNQPFPSHADDHFFDSSCIYCNYKDSILILTLILNTTFTNRSTLILFWASDSRAVPCPHWYEWPTHTAGLISEQWTEVVRVMSHLEFCVYTILHQNWKHSRSVSQEGSVAEIFFFHYKLPETVTTTTQQWEETKTHNYCHSAAGAAWLCCRGQNIVFRAEIWWRGGKTDGSRCFLFLSQVAKDTTTCWLKCASFLFYLMSEGSVWLSGWTPSDRHTPTVCPFTNLLWLWYCLHWQTGGRGGRRKLKMSELSPNSILLVNNVGQKTSLNNLAYNATAEYTVKWKPLVLFSHSLFPFAVEAVMTGVLTAELMPLAFNISPGPLESHGGSCPQALIRDQLTLLKS